MALFHYMADTLAKKAGHIDVRHILLCYYFGMHFMIVLEQHGVLTDLMHKSIQVN